MGRNDQRRRKQKLQREMTEWSAKHPDGPKNNAEQAVLGRLLTRAGVDLTKPPRPPATTSTQ